MGGHTRRSKQSVKASSTVICDCATTLEDWKQQIKVKDSIPANQQRLTFTSQRTVKQNFALAKLIPSRQWQILIDASIEDVCKNLKHWRATLRSKNLSAELLQPLVLRETDELASFLHSRTAEELREIGVPCCVFFLSFKEWIPTPPTKELSPSDREPSGLDLKVDEDFRDNLFFIDLYGDINGLPTPVPLRYVMNGSQLATKLFMVEQTAQYREDQKQRYQDQLVPALKDSNAENTEGSLEVNCQSSCSNDYVLEIEQNCEFTAFISRDHHRLRCIVLPVITIPLVDAKGSEEQPYVYLLNEDVKKGFREASSNVLALPSTSEIGEASTITARSIDQEVRSNGTADIPSRKNTKKKKKKKAKRSAKGARSGQDATVEAEISSCLEPSMELSHEEAPKDADNCLDAENATKKDVEDESKLLVGKKFKPGRASSHHDPKDVPLTEMENKVTSLKQRGFSKHVGQQQACHPTLAPSNSVSSTKHEHIKEKETGSISDLDGHVIDSKKEPEFAIGTRISDEMVRGDDASMHTEMASGSYPNPALHDHFHGHGYLGPRVLDPVQPASASGCNSDSHSISKLAGLKKHRESVRSSKFSAEIQSSLHRDYLGDYSGNSSDFQGCYAGSHTRLNQQSFWTHRAIEGQDYFPHYRSRTKQNFYTGVVPDDSRSSVPFWRHQRDGIPATSHSWSKPRALRADDGRRFPSSSSFQQFRNLPAWEQLPNLRQPTNGSSFPLHWESHAPPDKPLPSSSRGQSYTSFNMQQRKFGKSNKISHKFSDRWQPQGMPNERVALNPKLSNVLPNTSILCSNTKAESFSTTQTCFKDDMSNIVQGSLPIMNLEREMETTCESLTGEALEPNIVQTTASSLNSLSDDGFLIEHEKCGRQSPNSQVAKCVCEILDAVNASYESWGAYEQASRLNGKALCEFERVAKAVAPTIQASTSTQGWACTGCLCEVLASNSRQIPDVRLNALWQWYEEPSSYGLKVKLSDSSTRTGSNLQAFFVPYLSAVQLFGWSRKKKATNGKDMAAVQGGGPFDFDFLSQPIISILLPRPEVNDDSRSSEVNDDPHSSEGLTKQAKTSSEGADSWWRADYGALSSSSRHCHCDVELLYEFFEVEKPQQRKPLTDRIKELVSKSNGDVHVLENAKIQDLHPSSWFAVAWYPIYKIPDETFRAAFLTYHCLSCLQSVCLGSANTNHCMESCMHTITAPVVGLMSYNAQVKDWFSLSPSCGGSPGNALQQYLTKLEISATCMARGSCEMSSSFKHGDFAFFQSRRR